MKSIAKTEWCEAPHFQYLVSGTPHIAIANGTELDMVPSGHDAWVVGNEPAVLIDWFGASHYAKG